MIAKGTAVAEFHPRPEECFKRRSQPSEHAARTPPTVEPQSPGNPPARKDAVMQLGYLLQGKMPGHLLQSSRAPISN